jgi:putative NADH-flavin reductase
VLVSTYQPGNAATDFAGTVERSIADPTVYAHAARVLLAALVVRPATRLIVVGGAGSLERAPGQVSADDDTGLRAALRDLGLPEAYAAAVRGHRDALDTYRTSNRRWTYASPAEDIRAGERTGRFRLGDDQLLTDPRGRSQISYEDFAIALADEIELPRHVQRRFTVAY